VHNPHAIHLDTTGRAINRHVRDDPDVGAHELVFDVGDTAPLDNRAGISCARPARFQFREPSQTLEKFAPALIVEMAQADFERIHSRCGGDLVKEALIAEGIVHAAWRANPRRRERRFDEPMRGQLVVRQRVGNAEARVGHAGARSVLREPGENRCEQSDARPLDRTHVPTIV